MKGNKFILSLNEQGEGVISKWFVVNYYYVSLFRNVVFLCLPDVLNPDIRFLLDLTSATHVFPALPSINDQ